MQERQLQSDARMKLAAASIPETTAKKNPFGDALSYELGVTRFFGVGDIGTQGLLRGWAAPEDGHVWNDGPNAELLLVTSLPKQACTLSVEGSPFIHARHPQQEVTLFANGHRLGYWRFREAGAQIMTVKIEPEMFLSREMRGLLKLTWHLPNSIRPANIGEGGDGRELGFVFRSLSLV